MVFFYSSDKNDKLLNISIIVKYIKIYMYVYKK